MQEEAFWSNTSLCTILKFWEAVGGLAEKQVASVREHNSFQELSTSMQISL